MSYAGASNELVATNEDVLGKPALADRGRDLERRNGEEKRRRLFCATGLSANGFSVAVGIDADSSSREAS